MKKGRYSKPSFAHITSFRERLILFGETNGVEVVVKTAKNELLIEQAVSLLGAAVFLGQNNLEEMSNNAVW
jgi:hypothetical protein